MTAARDKLFIHGKKVPINDITALAFTQNPIPTLILDENSTIIKTNFALDKLLGYNENDLIGRDISILASERNEPSFYTKCYRNMMQSKDNDGCEMYVLCSNDAHLLVRKNSANITSNSKQHYILTFENIMEHRRILDHYRYLATHDVLTGLANRVLLHENFKKAQKVAIRSSQKMALLVCDINGFKQFNDRYGHELGDGALKAVAKTLEKVLCTNDTVSRYGGDEFVLILDDITDSNQIIDIVTKIKAAFPITRINDEEEYEINMSIGCAYFPDDGYSFNQLMKVADQNMYQDKNDFYNSDKT